MPLPSGTRLGPYEILAPLGAGGMGEVYRARDTRLGREVAVKVLPDELRGNRERLSRFDKEARSASALNHPAIVTIHDIGESNGVSYIAMELVSGQSLRELLTEGALPMKRALQIGAQVSDGLARAHEAGIVHRDLKPENVMVTRDGFAKILDFGLAKLAETATGSATHAPTQTSGATGPGVIMGTVGYMSPEQALGRPLDARSDQFSFGSILYEMATGKRAFARGSAPETLSAIIREEPEPIGSLAPLTPTPLRWIVERCLEKNPEERYASTRDLARDLARLRDHGSQISAEAVTAAPRRRRRWLVPAVAAGLAASALLGVLAGRRGRSEMPARPIRFAVSVPRETQYAPSEISRGFSVSPDGTRLGIEAYDKGRRRLFVRPLDSEQATELEGSLDATAHFWSPDSRFIAFFADGKLKKIPATGGPPQELCDASFGIIGTWNREGTILFTSIAADPGIFRVSDAGGTPVRLQGLQPGPPLWPQFLPDGRRFLYVVLGRDLRSSLWELRLGSIDSPGNTVVGRVASRVEYVPPGKILFVRDGALFSQSFDEKAGRLQGEPRRVVESLHYFNGPAHAAFSASHTGVLAYQTAARPSRLVWFDREGRATGTLGEPGLVSGFRISPDGGRVAVARGSADSGTSDIWLFETARGVSTRLHADFADESAPVWSPDGVRLLFRSDREGAPDVVDLTIGAPGSERILVQQPGVQQPEDVSRDGRRILFLNVSQSTVWDIWIAPSEKDGEPRPWLTTRFQEASPRFSPDGRWIAYESDESGELEVYAALTEGGGDKRRLSPSGGRLPRWRRDGRELTYLAPNGFMMSVSVTSGSRLEFGAPVPLFRIESVVENYDVTPDGSRFLASTPAEPGAESPLRVILNWPAVFDQGGP